MAALTIADVVVPEVYNDYFLENSIYKSAVYRSGIIVNNPKLDSGLAGGAATFNTPFWKTDDLIGGSATPVDEGTDLTPGKIGSGKMITRRQFREKSWGKNDVATVLAGSDPFNGLVTLTEAFWNKNYQTVLFKSVQGVIADNIANDAADMTNDITAVGNGIISSDAVIDTAMLYGDQGATVTSSIAMHSVVYGNLLKLNLIDTNPVNVQNIGWGTYLGKTIIVDDSLVVTGSPNTYWTILFSPVRSHMVLQWPGMFPLKLSGLLQSLVVRNCTTPGVYLRYILMGLLGVMLLHPLRIFRLMQSLQVLHSGTE